MSEFQPINIDDEEEIIVVNKIKKVKSKLLTKKVELIIEDEEKNVFINQVFRKDILANMLANTKLTGKELFDVIMKENKELYDERRQGWIFETLCQILIPMYSIYPYRSLLLLHKYTTNILYVQVFSKLFFLVIFVLYEVHVFLIFACKSCFTEQNFF